MLVMGFERAAIEAAMQRSAVKTVEGLIDWIDAHPNPAAWEPLPTSTLDKYVSKATVDALVAVTGLALPVAQKATLLSGNKGLDAAQKWVEDHKSDADFAEPVTVEEGPKLSAEEAAFKARQLQEQIRQRIKDEEEKSKLESERLRVKMGKELAEARRLQEEQKKKQEAELYLLNKQKDELAKQEMLRKLEEDRREKFGDKYVASEPKEKTPRDHLADTYDKMYKIHRMGQLRELQVCLQTLQKVAGNVLASPQNVDLRRINASNPNFCKRVKDVVGGAHILGLMGFEEKDGFFVMESPKLDVLSEFVDFLAQKADYLSTQI